MRKQKIARNSNRRIVETIFENKTIRILKMFWVRVFFENFFPVLP